MKVWSNPEIEELSIEATYHGGAVSGKFDSMWVDSEGNLCSTYRCS